jgi:hypothetical protein
MSRIAESAGALALLLAALACSEAPAPPSMPAPEPPGEAPAAAPPAPEPAAQDSMVGIEPPVVLTVGDELGPPPASLSPAEIWREVVQRQNRVHELVGSRRQSVESMTELARVVERMAALIQALPERLQHPNQEEAIRLERLARSTLLSVGSLYNAADSLIPGSLAMPMHQSDRWLRTLEQGLPADQIGDARVREPEPVDWNKVR